MLKQIRVKHFKNIEKETFDLSNNVLISGDNGSGKSSLLQAIRYCLTDSLPEKLSDYIMWGKSEFQLELDFSFENVDYSYLIVCKEKGSGKKILTYGNEELKGTDATKKIKEILSSDLLLYSSISEQGQSYSILLDSPTERLETFKSILGIDKIGEIVERMKDDLRELKVNSDSLKKERENLESKKFDFLQEFELPNIDKIKSDLKEQESQKLIKEANDRLKQEYDILLSEYNKKINRKQELDSLSELLQNKISNLEPVEYNEREYTKLLKEKQKQDIQLIAYNQSVKDFDSYVSKKQKLGKQLESLKQEKLEIKIVKQETLSFDSDSIEVDKDTLNSLQLKLKEVSKHLELVEQGKCPTCGQDFKNVTLKDLVLERNGLTNEVEAFKKAISEKQASLKEFEKVENQNIIAKTKIDSITKQIDSLEKELSELVEVLEPVVFEVDSTIESRIKTLEENKNAFEIYEKDKKELTDKLYKYKLELDSISELETPTKPTLVRSSFDEIEYKQLQKEVNVYEQKVSELERIQAHNKKIENEKKENQELIKEKELIYYNIQEEIRILEQSKTLLDKHYSSYVIEKGTKYVEKQMNVFFQKCYPKYEVFFKQTENKKSIDFYYSNGENDRVYSASLCSGFEKQLLAMAFRVALASITKVGFLIMDESDSDSSVANSINLYSNLIESKLFNQIICVTHKDETKHLLINDYNARLIEM